MELQPRGAPLPPFFAAVRRRHPDVDVVLLPADEAPGAESADDGDVADALHLTGRVAARAWTAVTGDDELPLSLDPRFAFGPDPASVVARVRASAHLDESPLDRLAALLGDDGWTVRQLPGAVDRIAARHADGEVVASYAAETGTLVLTVSSAPMTLGADRARELVGR